MKNALLTGFLLFFITIVNAAKVFDFNGTCQKAYENISSLRLAEGAKLVKQARAENPDNLIPEVLDSYIDFYILFFNEDPADFKRLMPDFDRRISRLDDGPENSPYYNFSKAIVYLQKACVEIKFGKQWSATWNFRRAFNLIKDNKKSFPTFVANNMIYGPMQVVAGIIPDGYKWMASIFGIKGSISEGIKQMQAFLNSDDPLAKLFFDEASFYYCYVLFYIKNEPDKVFTYISQNNLDVVNNHLLAYMACNLAINNKRSEYARQVILNRNRSSAYLKIPVWDFELGYIQLHHLQLNDAIESFHNFLNGFKGKFYVKDAYDKLSWCYYLKGNTEAAENARKNILSHGDLMTDADKQAQKEAQSGRWPNMLLLKARVLSDGGYNKEALSILVGKSASDFSLTEEKLEFAYRVARIYDDMGRDSDAIKMYEYAIRIGASRPEYFAARAALQIGMIYEKQGRNDLAIRYYKQCLAMKDHEYKDSLDQKAKSGIARCSGN